MLKITPGQPLTPLDADCCLTDTYCHLVDRGDLIKLQATQTPCSYLSCDIWSEIELPFSEWTGDWGFLDDMICVEGAGNERRQCAIIPDYAETWYRVVFTVNIGEGCVKVSIGGVYSEEITESGTYTFLILGGNVDDKICFETCGEPNTMCVSGFSLYSRTCVTEGEGWSPVENNEEMFTPDPNLVNGTFNSTSGWQLGPASFSITNAVTLNDYLQQNLNIIENGRYELEFTVTNFAGGNIKVYLAGDLIDTITIDGIYFYTIDVIELDNKFLRFEANGSTADISAVTMSGVQGWIRTISTSFCHDGSGALVDPVTYTGFLTIETLYRLEVNIDGMTSGSLLVTVGSSNSDLLTSSGTYIRYLNSGSSTDLVFTPSDDFDGCIKIVSIGILVNDYEWAIYKHDGSYLTDLNEFVSYYNEYVTLLVDPTKLCLTKKACITDPVETLVALSYNGDSHEINLDATDVELINEFFENNNLPFIYYVIPGGYCVESTQGVVDFVRAVWFNDPDTYLVDAECVRGETPDGCYYICVSDPCPEFPIYDILLLESHFNSEAEAIAQGWLWTPGEFAIAGGEACSTDLSVQIGILIPDYADGIPYKLTLTVDLGLATDGDLQVLFFGEEFYFNQSGTYTIYTTGMLGDNILLFTNLTDALVVCFDDVVLYAGSPVTHFTPCFVYGDFTNCKYKKISGSDDGEQFGFNFDTGFSLDQRIPMNFFNPLGEEDAEAYSYSDGRKRTTYAEMEELFNLGTDFLPRNAHNTLRLQRRLKNFLIDNKRYFAQISSYRPEWGDDIGTLAPVQFIVRKEQGTVYKRS